MNQNETFLETAPVGALMRRYSVPCIISLLVAALYNIVDQIFIANASYLGSYGNAANTVVFPLTIIALAIAVMIGDGACAHVSLLLGCGQKDQATRSVGSALTLSVLSGLTVMALYLIFADALLAMFGGTVNAETLAQSQEYFFWITLGIPFYMFGQAANPVIRSDGSPRFAMAATLAAGLSLWYLRRTKSFRVRRRDLIPAKSAVKKMLPLGFTSLISQLSLVAAMAAVNNMLRKYSALDPVFSDPQLTQIPMAVVGIVMKFFQIVISVAIGLAAGCIPVASYNMGAGRTDRAAALFRRLLIAEALTGAAALLVVELLPGRLIAIFGAASESVYYTAFAVRSFRVYLCMMVFATVNKGTFIYLQALGKAALSSLLSMLREVIFGVGLALLLPVFFGLDGVLYSMPVSDLLTFIPVAAAVLHTLRELSAARPTAVLTPATEKAAP